MDKYRIPIIHCSPILTSRPDNPGRQVDRWTSTVYPLCLDFIYLTLVLSPLLTVRQVDKYGIPTMPCSTIFTSGPVNPGRQIDRLTGRQVNKYGIPIIPCSPIFTSGPVNPGRQVDRSTG